MDKTVQEGDSMLGFKLFGSAVKWVMVTVSLPSPGNVQGTISVVPYPSQEICETDIDYSVEPNVARVCLTSKDYQRLVKTGSPIPIFQNSRQTQTNQAQLDAFRAAQQEYEQSKAQAERDNAKRLRIYEEQKAELDGQIKRLQQLGAVVQVKNTNGSVTTYQPRKK
jgi:hypothetical protein